MKKVVFSSLFGIALACFAPAAFAEMLTLTVGFENLANQINTNGGAWSDFSGVTSGDGITIGTRTEFNDEWGDPYLSTSFTIGGITFSSNKNLARTAWSGAGLSTKTDGNPAVDSFTNDMASITRSGYDSSAYGVIYGNSVSGSVYGGTEQWKTWMEYELIDYDPRPSMTFTEGAELVSMMVTNTSYNVNSMMNGDEYATAGGYQDLLIYGYDSEGNELDTIIRQTLGNGTDILRDWAFIDLSSLSDATELRFAFESDDYGGFGLNYPVYFAFDDIVYNIESTSTTPEPATLVILGLGLAGLGLVRRRK